MKVTSRLLILNSKKSQLISSGINCTQQHLSHQLASCKVAFRAAWCEKQAPPLLSAIHMVSAVTDEAAAIRLKTFPLSNDTCQRTQRRS